MRLPFSRPYDYEVQNSPKQIGRKNKYFGSILFMYAMHLIRLKNLFVFY